MCCITLIFGDTAMEFICKCCSENTHLPVLIFHIFKLSKLCSDDPDNKNTPPGIILSIVTGPICPLSDLTHLPVDLSIILIV